MCEERTQIGKSLLALFRESPVLIPTYKAIDAAGLGTIYEASRNAGILNEATSVPRETPIPLPPLIHDTKDQTSDRPEAGLAPKSPASKRKMPSSGTPARPTTPLKEFIVIDDSLEERAQEGLHVDVRSPPNKKQQNKTEDGGDSNTDDVPSATSSPRELGSLIPPMSPPAAPILKPTSIPMHEQIEQIILERADEICDMLEGWPRFAGEMSCLAIPGDKDGHSSIEIAN